MGDVLDGSYRLTRRIGAGGMGVVYEAEHVRLPRRFAVKLLRRGPQHGPDTFARFEREARIASRLGHPNIVDVVDFHQTPDGAPYLVMELLVGEELADRLARQGPLALDAAWSILDQATSAIAAAHQHGIVHRDLKPQNIFLARTPDRDDLVKVLDFGIAKVYGSGSIVTRTGAIFGTPGYMSPEQATGRTDDIDARTDVFALGAIAYEMLAGCPAFQAPSVVGLLFQVRHEEPTPLGQIRPEVPVAVQDVIETALRKVREERFDSVAPMREALRQAFGRPERPAASAPEATFGGPERPAPAAPDVTLPSAAPVVEPFTISPSTGEATPRAPWRARARAVWRAAAPRWWRTMRRG